MIASLEQLAVWMEAPSEDEHLEFKEAKADFDSRKLLRYCAALANEGGGKLILGVTNSRPRRVVGSRAFIDLNDRKHWLLQKLRLRVDVEELEHPDGRVVVFHIPSRPIGVPIAADGDYVMRSGESLTSMTPEQLRSIFDEAGPDFSAEICPGADLSSLSEDAIEAFRKAWVAKSGNAELARMPAEQLLSDSELLVNGGVTYAALVLMGEHRALGRFLADAEIVFEWRLREQATMYDKRREFRVGFFSCFDEIWREIDLRNQVHQWQDGLFRVDIPTFRERVIREALLNAVAHRDYRTPGSIFIKQSPTSFIVSSPGGFPEGITAENLLWKQKPRNRRIAETFGRCGFVERSGQGANLMFEWAFRDAKPLPDYGRSDPYEVVVRLGGQVEDEQFVHFLEKMSAEKQISFGLEELFVLARVKNEEPIDSDLSPFLQRLVEVGAVERIGRSRHVLARTFYKMAGRRGDYTRKRGLDREQNKALLLKHLRDNAADGSPFSELKQVLPAISSNELRGLLRQLKQDEHASVQGRTRGARWYPGPKSGTK
ncbi:MAG: putative DNA binding domain-containing protein [Polyangia bacterium]